MNKSVTNSVGKWLPVACLTFATFLFISSEFAPVGLLPEISATIGKDISTTGLVLTIYAWTVALLSLPLTLATAMLNRRPLLIALVFFFGVGNLLVGLSSTFTTVMLARLVIAMSHSIFWAIVPPLAVRLAPEGKYTYGLAAISAGGILASVLGMPLGKLIGHTFGWSVTFFVIFGLSIAVISLILYALPPLPSKNTKSMNSITLIIKNKTLLAAYLIIALLVTGHNTIYTYIVPFLTRVASITDDRVVSLLLLFGVSGIIGIYIGNKYMDKYMRQLLIVATIILTATIGLMYPAHSNVYATVAVMAIWSIGMNIMGLNMQLWILRLAPDNADASMALYSGIFNVGIGGGALVGGVCITKIGIENIGFVGALFVLPTIFMVFLFARNLR